MRYEGMIYRPPSEARSLIVQLTVGCAHNSCTFCTMYKDKKFHIRPLEDVLEDLAEGAVRYGSRVDRIFLADGDALVLDNEYLVNVLDFCKENYPYLRRVTSYGTAKDVLRKTPEELKELKAHGLAMVYMGAESGDPEVLQDIKKNITIDEMALAANALKEAYAAQTNKLAKMFYK
ncbi:MAG: radical SAM protein, partial [Parasporobacterium sp.]|nr:radical SAM protein [Parasporobacterium sp.]